MHGRRYAPSGYIYISGKEKFKKAQKNRVFWVVVKNNVFFFVEMSFFRKIGNTICVQRVKNKRAFSLQLSVFGKWSFVFVAIPSDKTL